MFTQARIKLTAWYLLIIMCISISFSVMVYRALTLELNRITRQQQLRNNRFFPPPIITIDPEIITETKQRIIFLLGIVNTSIFILSGVLGYVLAGRTLSPISTMIDEQNRFISDASHELRTPLTALKSAIEVNLRDPKLTLTQAKALLKDNIDDVNRLQSLSDSLLSLTQHEQQHDTKHVEQVVLDTILSNAIKYVSPIARNKKIAIAYKKISATMRGNPQSLTDLFVIMLDNAIKYSKQSSTINVYSVTKNNHVTISIQDNGAGIAKKDLTKIFDRFYRADNARSRITNDGYGLGLAIAKKIVDTHAGQIRVTSNIDEGSMFSIKFHII